MYGIAARSGRIRAASCDPPLRWNWSACADVAARLREPFMVNRVVAAQTGSHPAAHWSDCSTPGSNVRRGGPCPSVCCVRRRTRTTGRSAIATRCHMPSLACATGSYLPPARRERHGGEDDKAVMLMITFDGGTGQQYQATHSRMGVDEHPPAGLIFHAGAPIPGGWRVFDFWESRAAFDRFVESGFGPAVHELGDQTFAAPPEIAEFPQRRRSSLNRACLGSREVSARTPCRGGSPAPAGRGGDHGCPADRGRR